MGSDFFNRIFHELFFISFQKEKVKYSGILSGSYCVLSGFTISAYELAAI